jgi:3-mercaptopyruvate sulfurtransferase SseA
VALRLKRGGVRWVHPLHGGFRAWVDAGYPVEPLTVEAGARSTAI